MFLFWPGTSKGHSSCVLFACPFEARDTSTTQAPHGRSSGDHECHDLLHILCQVFKCSSHPTAQFYSPTSPRAQQFLEQFQVITFWLFNFRRNMRPKGNCWSCLGNFEIHRAQVPLPNSSFFEKPRENKLRQCSTIAGTDGKCSMAASSLRKVFSMILNGCIKNARTWNEGIQSSPSIWGRSNLPKVAAGRSSSGASTHPVGQPSAAPRATSATHRSTGVVWRHSCPGTGWSVRNVSSAIGNGRKTTSLWIIGLEYMCQAPSFVGVLTYYVTIEYIGILCVYIYIYFFIYIYILCIQMYYNIYIYTYMYIMYIQ